MHMEVDAVRQASPHSHCWREEICIHFLDMSCMFIVICKTILCHRNGYQSVTSRENLLKLNHTSCMLASLGSGKQLLVKPAKVLSLSPLCILMYL